MKVKGSKKTLNLSEVDSSILKGNSIQLSLQDGSQHLWIKLKDSQRRF
jgi:hypothetical protein